MRNWQETLKWYDENQTTKQIGFNPDGMCLKVCRVARGIGSMYPSAKEAQDNTPERYRVYRISQLRRGMVLYFDTVGDSNPYGHIVTMIGRVKGFKNWDSLDEILVETNSVKSGELVVVRASYFEKHWGDKFQFGATWLNGQPLDYFVNLGPVQKFRRSAPEYNVRYLDDAIAHGRRVDLTRYRDQIDNLVDQLSDDKRRTRIASVKENYDKHRILHLRTLDEVVQDFEDDGETRAIRNKLRLVIKSLPEK